MFAFQEDSDFEESIVWTDSLNWGRGGRAGERTVARTLAEYHVGVTGGEGTGSSLLARATACPLDGAP